MMTPLMTNMLNQQRPLKAAHLDLLSETGRAEIRRVVYYALARGWIKPPPPPDPNKASLRPPYGKRSGIFNL